MQTDQLVKIARDIAAGLSYLHGLRKKGEPHGHLRPSSILIDESLRAKVAWRGYETVRSENPFKSTISDAGVAKQSSHHRALKGDVKDYALLLLRMFLPSQSPRLEDLARIDFEKFEQELMEVDGISLKIKELIMGRGCASARISPRPTVVYSRSLSAYGCRLLPATVNHAPLIPRHPTALPGARGGRAGAGCGTGEEQECRPRPDRQDLPPRHRSPAPPGYQAGAAVPSREPFTQSVLWLLPPPVSGRSSSTTCILP